LCSGRALARLFPSVSVLSATPPPAPKPFPFPKEDVSNQAKKGDIFSRQKGDIFIELRKGTFVKRFDKSAKFSLTLRYPLLYLLL
jgi:hypothetical protein